MAGSGSVTVKILGDASQFQREIKTVESAGSGISSTFGKVAAAAAGLFAAAGVGAAISGALSAASESMKVAAQTEAVVKSTGGAAGVTAGYVGDLSHSLQNLSGVQDETIQTGANMLLTFTNIRDRVGEGNDIFTQATKTMLDMSVAMGTDAQTSALQLGKALNDPVKGMTALQRVGVTFTEQQKEQVKQMIHVGDAAGAQRLILAELSKEFGGSAAAAGAALTPMERLSIKWGDMQEALGTYLIPKIETLVKWGGEAVAWAKRNSDVLIPLVEYLGAVAAAVTVVVTAVKTWTAVQAALDVVLAANPIILIVGALAAVGAALVVAYQRSETFRNVVNSVFKAVVEYVVFAKNVFVTELGLIVNAFLGAAEWIVKAADKAFGWVPGIGGKLKTAAKAIEGFRDDVNNALDGIKEWTPSFNAAKKAADAGFRDTGIFATKAAQEAGNKAGVGLMGGFTDAIKAKAAPAKKEAKSVADQVAGILGGISSIFGRSNAQNAVVDATEKLNEALAEQASLPIQIANAEAALAKARKDAAAVSGDEFFNMLRAQEAVAVAQDKVNDAYAVWLKAVNESGRTSAESIRAQRLYEIALGDRSDAEKDLAKQQEASTGATDDVKDAEQKLADLREKQKSITDTVRQAQDGLTQAKLAAVQAEKDYIDQQAKLIGTTPAAIEQFRQLAEKAGLTKDEVNKLIAAYDQLRKGLSTPMPSLTGGVTAPYDPYFSMPIGAPAGGMSQFFDYFNHADKATQDYLRQLGKNGGSSIPSFGAGGVVPGVIGAPMLAVVHGGEEFSGVGRTLDRSQPVVLDMSRLRRGDTLDADGLLTLLKQVERRYGAVPIKVRD